MREYLQRVYSNILSHPDILALGEGIAQLLVQQAQSVVLMHRAVENVQRKLSQTKESLRHRIENEHPILSRIQPWMRDRMREAEENFIEECEWSAHEEALALCSHQNLTQTVYFLNRDLTFMKEVSNARSWKSVVLELKNLNLSVSERASSPERTAEGENSNKDFPMADTNLVTKELDNKTQFSRSVGNHSNCTKQYSDFYYNASR